MADVIAKLIFYTVLFWMLYTYSNMFATSVEFLVTTMKRMSPIGNINVEGTENSTFMR